jgi:hypothetical protein
MIRPFEGMRPRSSHLWDDLEPDIDVDEVHALPDGRADSMLVSVSEPEGKQTQRVL